FPVEVVAMYRVDRLQASGRMALPVPQIDLPIAYAWCETYVPDALNVQRWSGPMANVAQYSSETASAELGYGSGQLAEGYSAEKRLTGPQAQVVTGPAAPTPKVKAPRVKPKPPPRAKKPSLLSRIFGGLPSAGMAMQAPLMRPAPAPPPPATRPAAKPSPARVPLAGDVPVMGRLFNAPAKQPAGQMLARNYYRTGKAAYEKGDYDIAAESLGNVIKLAPESVEASNSLRLMGNIDLARNKLVLRSRAERAAGSKVRGEQRRAYRKTEEKQVRILEQAQQDMRAGKYSRAQSQLKVAESLGRQLRAQGADAKEQDIRLSQLRASQKRLKGLGKSKTIQLRQQLTKFKASGEYTKALQAGKDLRQQLVDQESLFADDNADANGRARRELQKELDELAVKSVQAAGWQRRTVNLSGQIAALQKQDSALAAAVRSLGARQTGEQAGRLPGRVNVARIDGSVRLLDQAKLLRPGTTITDGAWAFEGRAGKKATAADVARLQNYADKLGKAVAAKQQAISKLKRPTETTATQTVAGDQLLGPTLPGLAKRALAQADESPADVAHTLAVFALRNADAKEMARVIGGLMAAKPSSGRGGGGRDGDRVPGWRGSPCNQRIFAGECAEGNFGPERGASVARLG
ncbi:hypothetical protein LCGC14_0583930, partial [marine sediment metagenome]